MSMLPMFARAARGSAVAVLLAALASPAPAQFVEPPPPAAYALRNVTLVSADGSRRAGVDVVVRGERIEAIGRGLAIPADALELPGDSLLLYPGIVDAWGALEVEFARDSVDRSKLRSWDPPRELQGFLPHRRALDVLAPSASDIEALRRQGVVALAAHPTEGLMPGRGALLLLRNPERTAEVLGVSATRLAIVPVLGPVATFRGTRGFYPTTGMAMPSFFRQAFMDARRAAQIADATPRGAVPPPFDADYAVLSEVVGGGVPMFFVADEAEQIRHVLRLAEEFRIRPIVLGGAEAWQLADELARREVPVLVSLDFPKPTRWKPDARRDSAQSPAAVREQRELEARYANAGRLARAGVRVALTSGGKAEVRDSVRKVIEHGMSEADALRALTLTPARLFGFEQLASVTPGGPATFIVADGPLFAEKTRVRYSFVEGALVSDTTRASARDTTAAGDDAPESVAGTWDFEARASVGDVISGEMTLAQEGERVTGSIEMGELGVATIRSGSYQDGRLSLTLSVTSGGQSMSIDVSGTVTGDSISGTGTGPTGSFEWTATRAPGGAR